jgi:hypothetical protein
MILQLAFLAEGVLNINKPTKWSSLFVVAVEQNR